MATPVAIMVSACQTVQHAANQLCAGNLLEGVKRGIGNLVFVTLPPKRPLRAACQRVRGIIRKRLAPFVPDTHGHTCGAPISLAALTQGCAPRGSPFPRCAHSRLRPQRVPPCLRNYNHTLFLTIYLSCWPTFSSNASLSNTISSTVALLLYDGHTSLTLPISHPRSTLLQHMRGHVGLTLQHGWKIWFQIFYRFSHSLSKLTYTAHFPCACRPRP